MRIIGVMVGGALIVGIVSHLVGFTPEPLFPHVVHAILLMIWGIIIWEVQK